LSAVVYRIPGLRALCGERRHQRGQQPEQQQQQSEQQQQPEQRQQRQHQHRQPQLHADEHEHGAGTRKKPEQEKLSRKSVGLELSANRKKPAAPKKRKVSYSANTNGPFIL
jgi:hypothetical protein